MKGYSQSSQGQVHYQHEGDSGPAIVLFHESPLSSAIFAPALPHLGRSFRAYAFDTPGYGNSDRPARPPSVQEYGALLLEAIDDLGIDRFIVVGCHTGASIGLEVARQAGPARITHAILTGVTLMKPHEWESWLAGRVLGGDQPGEMRRSAKETFAPDFKLSRDGAHVRWAWDRLAARGRKDWPPTTPIELVNMGVMQLLLAGVSYNWGYKAIWAYDAEPALRGLTCPVLLLNAAEDPLAHLDDTVSQMLGGAPIVHIEGLTGQLPWRVPERYASEIERFVGVAAPV